MIRALCPVMHLITWGDLPFRRLRTTGFAAVALFSGSTLLDASITHRWSFGNATGAAAAGTVITDSVGGQNAVVRGISATFASGSLTLPGSTSGNQTPAAISAYVDLPNGIISSKTNLTVEIWTKPVSYKSNQRLFDFGRTVQTGDGLGAAGEITGLATTAPGSTTASDGLTLTLNTTTANSLSPQRFEAKLDGVTAIPDPTGFYRVFDSTLPTAAGTEYHYVMTFEDGAGAFGSVGGRASWYRNGVLVTSMDTGFRLNQIEDVNNWLGRSLSSSNSNTNAAFNEARIYNHAFTAAEVVASGTLGPDPAIPTGQPDTVTMHHGQKAGIAVLANDTAATVPVIAQAPQSGTASVQSSGRILYTHTTGTPVSDTFTYRATNAAGQSAPVTVTVNFSNQLRLAGTGLNVPQTPPPTVYQIADAFGALAFPDPVCLATPPGETQRLFVCQKGGLLRMIPNVNAATPTASTFLDLPTLLATRNESVNTESERGLLGLAFHPDYATNRFFYVFYSVDKNASTAGTPIFQRVSRFTTRSDNPNLADTTSERILIEQEDQENNHNGGDLHFGPVDKYLYITFGDEGGQNDTRNNSQRITKDFFSAIARIDVDKRAGNLEPNAHPNPGVSDPATNAVPRYETAPGSGIFEAAYSIPIDNPFVTIAQGGTWNGSFNGTATSAGSLPYVRSEFWAVGFRNPWRVSFDLPTGSPPVAELWVGDVGGSLREEIDIAEKGKNYGWNYREGLIQRPNSPTPPADFVGTSPIYDYRHTNDTTVDPNFTGNSVTGGFVYRGTRFNNLVGAYLFADYSSGHVWTLRRNGASTPTVERITGEGGIAAFGKDPSNGDVLMANVNNDKIRRLIGNTPGGTFPSTLGATGLFADLADLSPNPGLLPYKVKLPFWSDHAIKRRWFVIPELAPQISWSRDDAWTFPTGQIWVKHFDLPLTRSNPPQPGDSPTPSKRIETRILVKNDAGSYGVSYRWNEAGTEATLAPDEGVDFDINLTRGGSPYAQRWRIPSRAECSICHTAQGGHSLSMNTRQINLTNSINGFTGNQLDLLKNGGYFSNTPESPNILPVHIAPDDENFPVEARVRSYLEVNCTYCHKAGGTAAPAAWDGRIELTLDQTGLINGVATNNGGDPANQLVVPGDLTHSVVLNRVAAANGFTRMPPLGSNELDSTNIALLTRWIQQSLPARTTYPQWREAKFQSAVSTEGEPGEDPDGDGRNNQDEYLAGTEPLSGGSIFQASHSLTNNLWSITVPVPANRSMQVETSGNLSDWSLWNVPGNHGLPQNAGAVTLQGSVTDGPNFFRVKIQEN